MEEAFPLEIFIVEKYPLQPRWVNPKNMYYLLLFIYSHSSSKAYIYIYIFIYVYKYDLYTFID